MPSFDTHLTVQALDNHLTGSASAPTVRNMYTSSTGDGQMKPFDAIAAALVLVGALNWGLVAIANFDLVAWIFGEEFGTTNAASRIVYGLVGIAGVYGITALLARRRHTTAHHTGAGA